MINTDAVGGAAKFPLLYYIRCNNNKLPRFGWVEQYEILQISYKTGGEFYCIWVL